MGSIKVVANEHGAVLKTLDVDSFGNLLADSNPEFFLPLGFAGGDHDVASTPSEVLQGLALPSEGHAPFPLANRLALR